MNSLLKLRSRVSLLLAACALAAVGCVAVIANTTFVADMSAFLPRKPTAQQQLLVDQLKVGIASRVVMFGISANPSAPLGSGADSTNADTLAQASKDLAAKLRADSQFTAVINGESGTAQRDQALVFDYRYHLSDRVKESLFSPAGLQAAIQDNLYELAMGAGLLSKALFFKDPTGETLHLIEQLLPASQPNSHGGVWFGRDGKRAVLLVQTQAQGSDLDGQQRAIEAMNRSFDAVNTQGALRREISGAPVFAVNSRASIEREAKLFSGLGSVLIVLLLWAVYRSFKLLALGAVPVLSGALIGLTAVALAFGSIHGITVGFGVTLIGEAVDYAVYFFIQQGRNPDPEHFKKQFWPTIRLGVLTSICGFCALLFSGFTGLAQLGLFSIAGLAAAALMTRYVLPHCLPNEINIKIPVFLSAGLQGVVQLLQRQRLWVFAISALCVAVLLLNSSSLWQNEISALSPVSPAAQKLDESLRADISAPDMGYLVLLKAGSEQEALEKSERVSAMLRSAVQQNTIAGFESPSNYLPSVRTQNARLAALPNDADLSLSAQQVAKASRMKVGALDPFLDGVAQARTLPALTPKDMAGSAIGLALSNLLLAQEGGYVAYLSLKSPKSGVFDEALMRQKLSETGVEGISLLDIKAEADGLYQRYVREALVLSSLGLLAIACLLRYALRSWRRALRVLGPQMLAVLWVMGLLVALGVPMTLLHLVGMLLVVAVGSNYGLFFDQLTHSAVDARVLVSLVLANTTTVIGFGVLALSSLPILQAFGLTVGPGAWFALLLSAALAPSLPEAA